jgi:hypothetical protein
MAVEIGGTKRGGHWEGCYVSFLECDESRNVAALPNPLCVGSRGWGMLGQQNHATGGGNGSIMVGMFVCLCLASQSLSSGSFSFPPKQT